MRIEISIIYDVDAGTLEVSVPQNRILAKGILMEAIKSVDDLLPPKGTEVKKAPSIVIPELLFPRPDKGS